MNLKEAYSILEIPQTATPEEAKKKYRDLTKKFHPDINKEADAEAKFKKINEAYQIVSTGKDTEPGFSGPQHWAGDVGQAGFNPFGNQQAYHSADNIELKTTISFKASVFGCKQDLKFNRQTKCKDCNGNGETTLNNGCVKCGGRGQITNRNGNMIFVQTCDKCYGRSKAEPCKTCNSRGILDAEAAINVSIPGGIQDSNVLRLGGMGNFVTSFGNLDQHTDVHLHVRVIAEEGLRLEGPNVVCDLEVSLLDALKGCKKTVKTVSGDKEIEIKQNSKNKDEVIIPHLGVNHVGNQKVILDIIYPKEIDKLVDFLTNNTG